jgi:hypothetical protein
MTYAIPAASIVYTSYEGPAWHLGPLALTAILVVVACGIGHVAILTSRTPVRKSGADGRPGSFPPIRRDK